MKLKRLRLVNFQGHVDSRIEFSEFFNCIIGPTNSGKSSIFRALLFLVHNEWHEDFIHKPDRSCTVLAEFDNDTALARRKGHKVNEVLLRIGDRKELYKDFGTKYPQPVQDILNSLSGEMEDLILNFADQDDMLFLLKAPNQTRIKMFGQLTGVGVLEQIAEDVKSDHRKATLTKNTLDKRITQLEEDAKKLPDVAVKEKELASRRTVLADIREKYSRFVRLLDVQNKITANKEKRAALNKNNIVLQSIPAFEEIVKKYEHLNKLSTLQEKIQHYREAAKGFSDQLLVLDQRIEKGTSNLDIVLNQLKACPACGTELSAEKRRVLRA